MSVSTQRDVYEAPRLMVLGTIAELTLNGKCNGNGPPGTPPGKNPGARDADCTASGAH